MKRIWKRATQRLGAPFLISAIVVGFYAVLLFAVWILSERSSTGPQWTALEAAATAIAGLLALGALVYTAIQVAEIREARHADVLERLSETYGHEDEIAARRYILQEFPEAPDDPGAVLRAMPPEGKQAAKRVLNTFDQTWMSLEGNPLSETRLVGWLSPMVVKSWERLEPYVLHTRELRQNEDDYYGFAQSLYERCRTWRTANQHAEMKIGDHASML